MNPVPHLRDIFGAALIGAFVGALFVLFWKAIPENNSDVITYMLGQLSGFAAAIVAFHYSTNAQSQRATENTGAAFAAIEAAAKSGTGTGGEPQEVTVVNPATDPVQTEETGR